MEIALCNEVLRTFPLKQQCELAARLGYDSLELAPFTLAAEPHRLTSAEIGSVRQLITNAGLNVVGLHWLLVSPPGLSITSADPDIRTATLEVLRGLVQLCAELDGRLAHRHAALPLALADAHRVVIGSDLDEHPPMVATETEGDLHPPSVVDGRPAHQCSPDARTPQ